MTKRTLVKTAIAAAFLFGVSTVASAQTNINFAPGRSSASLSGRIGTNGSRLYRFRAKAGQYLTVTVRSGNNYVFAGVEAVGEGRTVSGRLPYSSSYVIELSNGGNATNYTMTISIR